MFCTEKAESQAFYEIFFLASKPYLSELEDASSYLLGQYSGLIRQFTIDLLQNWSEGMGDDYSEITVYTPAALCYDWETLKVVFNKELATDCECLEVMLSIAQKWSADVEERLKIFNDQ